LILESELGSEIRVALVGGSKKDAELDILADLKKVLKVTTFGIENSEIFLDLNIIKGNDLEFDLVLCSHVLEHVYDLKNSMHNLVSLVAPKGYLWINCPTSNRKHGSPEYFSSGYSGNMLSKLFDMHQIVSLEVQDLGSERNYKFVHLYQRWPNSDDLTPNWGSLLHQILRTRISRIPHLLFKAVLVTSWSEDIRNNSLFSTETYGLGRKL